MSHDRHARVVLLVAQCVGTAVFAVGLPTGLPLDDAWIHQVVARNLRERGQVTLLAGGGGGSTSVLWTLTLAVFPTDQPESAVWCVRGLGALLWLVSGQLLFSVLRQGGVGRVSALIGAGGGSLTGNVLWYAWSGMETSLLVALELGAVAAWQCGRRVGTAILLMLLPQCRPEGILLAGALLVFEGRRSWWFWISGSALAGSCLAAAIARVTAGTWFPSTLAGRRWLYGFADGVRYDDMWRLWLHWPAHLARYGAGGLDAAGFVMVSMAAVGVFAVWQGRMRGCQALCACAAATMALYTVVMPVIGHGGRYQPLNVVLVVPLAVLGLLDLAHRLGWQRYGVSAAAVTVLIVSSLSIAQWHQVLRAGIVVVDTTHRTAGRWVREHVPLASAVAAFDVGAIAYERRDALFDLGGVGDPAAARALAHGRVAEYLTQRRVSYLVLPDGHPTGVSALSVLGLDRSSAHLEAVFVARSPAAEWQRAWQSTYVAWPSQVVYRVVSLKGGAE